MQSYKAEAVLCMDGEDCTGDKITGTWNAIYDQALDIELDNGLRFVTNLRYNTKPNFSEDPLTQVKSKGVSSFGAVESGDYAKFDSDCSRTMVGFVQMKA